MDSGVEARIAAAARQLNLTPAFLTKLLLLLLACARRGMPVRVVSLYRSPEYQQSLRDRWDRGDRAGLAVRPAATSRHSSGRAGDVDHPDDRHEEFGRLAEGVGLTWGGRWRTPDWNHVEDF